MLFVMTGSDPEALSRLRRRQMTFQTLSQGCQDKGIDMMLTTPDRIRTRREVCRGWSITDAGKWVAREAPLRDGVIYDAMYLADLKAYSTVYRRLMSALPRMGVVFFNPKLPAKNRIHEWLLTTSASEDKSATDGWHGILPVTHLDVDVKSVLRIVRETEAPVWFKPTYGSGGRNMLYIEKVNDHRYQVRGERFYNRNILGEWSESRLAREVQRALAKRPYFLQNDVNLIRTKDGRKVDFRVTLARGAEGNWDSVALTARFGKAGRALTNYHAGGSIQSLTELNESARKALKDLSLTDDELSHIKACAMTAAKMISDKHSHVGILGIDVGISATNRQAFVYDFNSRPGRDILTDKEVVLMMNQVAEFAGYLLNTAGSL